MARDLFDAPILVLCTEAEHAAVVLRALKEAVRGFGLLGVDAPQRVESLRALGRAGRDAYTNARVCNTSLLIAQSLGHERAEAYLKGQTVQRELIRGMRAVFLDEVEADARHLASLFDLRAPRLEGALAQARCVLEELERSESTLTSKPAGQRLLAQARIDVAELHALYVERSDAQRELRGLQDAVRRARSDLQRALRSLRSAWRAAQLMSDEPFQDLTFEWATAERARREAAARKAEEGEGTERDEAARTDEAAPSHEATFDEAAWTDDLPPDA